MSDQSDYRIQQWSKHFDEIDAQIARLAVMCEVRILDPGVIERVLKNDSAVCGKSKPQTFAQLRGLLMMHYSSRAKAVVALGEQEALLVVQDTVARLRKRIGERLGDLST